METIIAAAYKLKESNKFPHEKKVVYKDQSVQTYPNEFDDIYKLRIARHHAEILHMFGNEIDKHSDGFYTSYGRYVDRKTAAKIALNAGQCTKCIMGDKLDSSDIF